MPPPRRISPPIHSSSTCRTEICNVAHTSPVVAAGNIQDPQIPQLDLDGQPRTVCGTIDMGVYESHPDPAATLTSSNNSSVLGTSVTFTATLPDNCNTPTGTITFLDGGTVLGTAALGGGTASFSTASLTLGSHNITVKYGGDASFDPSVSAVLVQVVAAAGSGTTVNSITSLTASPNPAFLGQNVLLSAAVTSAVGNGVSGSVAFLDGTTPLGTAAVNAGGVVNLTIATLASGTHSLSAVYGGAGNLNGSTSAIVQEIILAPAFTLSVSPASFSLAVGQSGKVAVTLGSVGGYTGTVSLQVNGLPLYTMGTFTPATVALTASGNASATLLITTGNLQAAADKPPLNRRGAKTLAASFSFFSLITLASARRRRPILRGMLAFVTSAFLLATGGCTNIGLPFYTAVPGTYSLLITGTDGSQITEDGPFVAPHHAVETC